MFDYVINKIESAEFTESPFRHLYIEDLFSEEHFSAITSAREIGLPPQNSDSELFDALFGNGYKIINFPGCITDRSKYIAWHKSKGRASNTHSACEGFGVTLRLEEPKTEILMKVRQFLSSEKFNETLAKKFEIQLSDTFQDNGIQKYLDGYEISPHPDNRRKALTFMVNINPDPKSVHREHHTHFLRLKPEYDYVCSFWKTNIDCETCWIPWDWCSTVSVQAKNNSIVIFSPSFETLHGVRASYNHLAGQRTQLYGNLWYKKTDELTRVEWEDLDLKAVARAKKSRPSVKNIVASMLPSRFRRFLKRTIKKDTKTVVKVRLKK
jgi:hypothetical protein